MKLIWLYELYTLFTCLIYKYLETLKRFLKSDKLNKDLIINNVYQLVGRNFEEVVMQEDKHVLVFFSRRACGLCIEVINNIKAN